MPPEAGERRVFNFEFAKWAPALRLVFSVDFFVAGLAGEMEEMGTASQLLFIG
jgi:hypothetical protein